jgi:hypothetical protein
MIDPDIPRFMLAAIALSALGLVGLHSSSVGRTLILPASLVATAVAAPISRLLNAALRAGLVFLSACGQDRTSADALRVPRGFFRTLRIETAGGIVSFGPFIGYYFAPESGSDLSRLRFVCFNERTHYTRDLPENALLFEGQARCTVLPDADFDIPYTTAPHPARINVLPASSSSTGGR